MSEHGTTLVLAAGSGFITGMRSLTLPAFLSRHLKHRNDGSGMTHFLAAAPASLLSLLAAGEMIADKTPLIPDRTEPLSLVGRAVVAGLCGVAIAEHRNGSRLGGALISSLTAVGSTFLSYKLRKKAGLLIRVPDPFLGLTEDILVLLATSSLIAAFEA